MKLRINNRIYNIKDIDVKINLEPNKEIVRYLRITSLNKEVIEMEFMEPFKAMICGMETKLDGSDIGTSTEVKFISLKGTD